MSTDAFGNSPAMTEDEMFLAGLIDTAGEITPFGEVALKLSEVLGGVEVRERAEEEQPLLVPVAPYGSPPAFVYFPLAPRKTAVERLRDAYRLVTGMFGALR